MSNKPPAPFPNLEKRPPVNQKVAARFQRVESFLKAHPALFANQGAVAATYRTYRGKRLGPYFQLAYRDCGRQLWIYLGRSHELAQKVRDLLAKLHCPRDIRRQSQRLQTQARASLRNAKNELKRLLAIWGIQLKGFEFRGARQGLARYAQSLAPPPRPENLHSIVPPPPT